MSRANARASKEHADRYVALIDGAEIRHITFRTHVEAMDYAEAVARIWKPGWERPEEDGRSVWARLQRKRRS